ncbi:MAG: GspE/PulE family protein [Candidatus Omnitrophica bacterium]|nr:GspE/PulE family protein [Candidatus Omnitrophota bacterium]
MTIKEKIIKYIQEDKKCDKKVLIDIAKRARTYADLRSLLIESGLISEEELLLMFSKELKIPFLDLKKYKLPYKNQELLPKDIAIKHKVLPLCKIGNVLTLATANPLDVITHDDIKIITNAEKVDLVLSREKDISRAINFLYKSAEHISETLSSDVSLDSVGEGLLHQESKQDLESSISESKHPPVVRAIDVIIYNALKKRASDIHIEPCEDKLLIRYRVDGSLADEFSFPKTSQQAVIARLKIISSLDITESRLPQDGRFRVKFESREIDFRVSSLPTHFGEKFVLRVLDRESLSIGLKKLGFSPGPLALFEEAIKAPFGIMLVTGPTGSGKSTTLYSIINQINSTDKNIITIEEPVEYHLEGITQIQVNAEIGLTFSAGLRSVLRQSPDVIMVGEIRDAETADTAIKASLTGETILSTLHTNSAVGAIARLRDMGTEPFLLASSLVALTAQRLVRKLCPKCKEGYIPDKDLLKRLGFGLSSKIMGNNEPKKIYRAKGCPHCAHSGYRGRVAILEIILLDDKIREMIIELATEETIIQYAREFKGYQSLAEDGFLKCSEGVTSAEEVIRVISE